MAGTKKDGIKYKIVRYLHDNQVTTIPETWIENKRNGEGLETIFAAWPEGQNDYSINTLVAKKKSKKTAWPSFEIQILGTANSLLEAKAKEKIASSDESCTDLDAEYIRQEEEHKTTFVGKSKSKKRRRRRKRDDDFEYEEKDSSSGEDSSENSEGDNEVVEVPELPPMKIFHQAEKHAVLSCKNERGDALLAGQQKENEKLKDSNVSPRPTTSTSYSNDVQLELEMTIQHTANDLKARESNEDNVQEQSSQGVAVKSPTRKQATMKSLNKEFDDIDLELMLDDDRSSNEKEALNMQFQNNASLNDGKDDQNRLDSGSKNNFPEDDNLWHIVKYVKATKLTLIPSVWINNDQVTSQWPPDCISKSVITKYIMSRRIPDEDWKTRLIKETIGVTGVYAEGLEQINSMEAPMKKVEIEVNESIIERESHRKILGDLSASDLNSMSERDLLCCTITGFQEVVHGQQQVINEIRNNRCSGASTSAQPTPAGYQHENLRDNFPASTLRKFKENETRLSEDPAYRSAVTSFMADVGGENGHKSCQKMLAKALTDNVANKYCMQGHSSNKMAFNTTAIWNVIKDVVVQNFKNHPEKKYTFASAENTCSLWLRQADHRLTRRKKRANRKTKMEIDDYIALEEVDNE